LIGQTDDLPQVGFRTFSDIHHSMITTSVS